MAPRCGGAELIDARRYQIPDGDVGVHELQSAGLDGGRHQEIGNQALDRFDLLETAPHDLPILGCVSIGELRREQIVWRASDDSARSSDTMDLGKRMIDREILAVDRLHAEHSAWDGGEHVGDGDERAIEHSND